MLHAAAAAPSSRVLLPCRTYLASSRPLSLVSCYKYIGPGIRRAWPPFLPANDFSLFFMSVIYIQDLSEALGIRLLA